MPKSSIFFFIYISSKLLPSPFKDTLDAIQIPVGVLHGVGGYTGNKVVMKPIYLQRVTVPGVTKGGYLTLASYSIVCSCGRYASLSV